MKKIVLAGGSGFIGQALIEHWGQQHQIIVLTRGVSNNNSNNASSTAIASSNVQFVQWDGKTLGPWKDSMEGADLLINLTGKSVNCRYTPENKKEIVESRINSVNILGEAIRQCKTPPSLWINAASATIYREAFDKPQTEKDGEIGSGFSVEVCKTWEQTFFTQATPNTRKVGLRISIALGQGGVMIPFFNLVKWGLGGHQGSGKQMFSWIHINDLCSAIDFIDEHPELTGSFNIAAPNAVTNKVLMKSIQKACGHFTGLPATTWMIKLGAKIIGTEEELVLKSRWVYPQRLLDAGFQFQFPMLKEALTEIVSKTPKRRYKLF